MSTFTTTGGLRLGGCAEISVVYAYIADFNVGDIVYDVRQARLGCLEAIAIKKIRVVDTYGSLMYLDTFNRNWNAYDLAGETTARNLAITYLQNQVLKLESSLENCSV